MFTYKYFNDTVRKLTTEELKIDMLFGGANTQRYINVTKLDRTLGPSLCASLPTSILFIIDKERKNL